MRYITFCNIQCDVGLSINDGLVVKAKSKGHEIYDPEVMGSNPS